MIQTACARIAVAAQDTRSRNRLTAVLRSDPSLSIVWEASDETGLLSSVRRPLPDILLLDSALASRMNGAAHAWSSARILLLANAITQENVVQVLRLGARGILPDTSPPYVVLKSIRTVLADEYWLDAESLAMLLSMTRQLLAERSQPFDNQGVTLTERELTVVAMIAGGSSNRHISQQLSISERTVKHHLTNIFAKLGVSSRLQLANFALTQGLTGNADRSLGPRPGSGSSRRVASGEVCVAGVTR